MNRIVIVGGGQAAGQAAASVRQEGFEGEVILVSDEPHPPYQRPPLSKQFLAGAHGLERVYLRPVEFYEEKGIELRCGRRVERIDREARTLALDDGTALEYGKLLLATGARVRRLDAPGAELDGVCYLRSIDDAEALAARLGNARRLAVVGGGYIGLEVASVAVERGLEVTVIEAMDRLLARVATPELSSFYARLHRARGADVLLATSVDGFEGDGRVAAVRCADGSLVEADVAVVGIGVIPNVELAENAGIACANGIVVDASCRTSDPSVFAAGDCTNHPNAYLGEGTRLESVANAMDQSRVAAAVMCGSERTYDAEPWFWSDQYDVKLQMAGSAAQGDASVTRGDADSGPFITFHLRDGVVVGVDAVNSVREFLSCRKLVAGRLSPDPAALADSSIPVKDLL